MKKLLVVLVVLAVAMTASAAFAGIANSKHDLSSGSTAAIKSATIDQICVFCHTPHNADTSAGPLWNRTLSAPTQVYSSPTFSGANAPTVASVGTVSKACLGCHDGTTGLDALRNLNGSTNPGSMGNTISGNYVIGNDLSNDHPVGFNPTNWVSPAGDYKTSSSLPLYSGQLECATCHSVHDNTNGKFLRMSNTGSALCLNCHTK